MPPASPSFPQLSSAGQDKIFQLRIRAETVSCDDARIAGHEIIQLNSSFKPSTIFNQEQTVTFNEGLNALLKWVILCTNNFMMIEFIAADLHLLHNQVNNLRCTKQALR